METFIAALIIVFGAIAAIVGVTALGVVVNGWVLSHLWIWFLVPLGLPVISVAHCIGISMVTSWLTYQYQTSKGEEDGSKVLTNLAIVFIVRPLATLGIGYIVKQYM